MVLLVLFCVWLHSTYTFMFFSHTLVLLLVTKLVFERVNESDIAILDLLSGTLLL